MKTSSFPWATVIKIAVSLSLLAVLAITADFGKILESAAGFKLVWIPIILALIAASVAISAWKWGVLLQAQGLAAPFSVLFAAYSSALFFNNFLPSSIGGDAVRILLLSKRNASSAGVSASVVVERTLATASLGLLGFVSGLFSKHPHQLGLYLLAFVGLLGLLLSLILVLGYLPKFIKDGKGKISAFLRDFALSAQTLRKNPAALLQSFVLALVFQVFVAAVVGAVAAGLGKPVQGFPDLVYVTSASSILAMIPLGLNGYGLREGAFIVLLGPYGFAPAEALAISVLFAVSVSVYSISGAFYWAAQKKGLAQNEVPA